MPCIYCHCWLNSQHILSWLASTCEGGDARVQASHLVATTLDVLVDLNLIIIACGLFVFDDLGRIMCQMSMFDITQSTAGNVCFLTCFTERWLEVPQILRPA